MTLSLDQLALAILNDDRAAHGLPPVQSRGSVPDSDGYVRNARAVLSAIEAQGYAVVPREASFEMQCAAIDVDSLKLGDISPLGFRCSPQQLFQRCYAAMLQSAPKIGDA